MLTKSSWSTAIIRCRLLFQSTSNQTKFKNLHSVANYLIHTNFLNRKVIWDLRLRRLEKNFLEKWSSFTIWNAGKQGRRLYRSLQEQYRSRVVSFCDVDAKKIQQGVYIYEDSKLRPKPRVPIVHFTNAKPPFVICVKLVKIIPIIKLIRRYEMNLIFILLACRI